MAGPLLVNQLWSHPLPVEGAVALPSKDEVTLRDARDSRRSLDLVGLALMRLLFFFRHLLTRFPDLP